MRNPIANKTHYPNGITLLDKKFEDLFEGPRGPGSLPLKKSFEENTKPVKAIIVPHAPYDLAGSAMAWGYKSLAEEGIDSNLYIIFAQSQTSQEEGVTMQTFQTPYGEVRTDQTFIRSLMEKGHLKANDRLHEEESTIEIQLPFLQYINKFSMEKVKIVPIIVNSQTDFGELAVDIKETLVEQGKEATFIFVSNLTSYGRNFKYVPFTEQIPENIAHVDKQFIQAIQETNKDKFELALKDTLAPISGYYALLMFFSICKGDEVLLEQNYLSGDINNNYLTTVSYASFVVR
ncbi:AmmeMemoRadiSam system protein B [Candidatus Woesearchaeota archaeon]|nr:AmmeMemoRadiSam system protein B [Candidatus Woesearchaeota archaeon]